jgi:preprotein translocase subunit SecG
MASTVHMMILVAHVFLAVAIIGLVLLQRGKGADAGAGFGAGASGTVFGARGSATALSKATAVLATLFFVTSLALAFLGGKPAERPKSLLEQSQQAPATQVPAPANTAPAASTPPATTAPAQGSAPATTPSPDTAPTQTPPQQ